MGRAVEVDGAELREIGVGDLIAAEAEGRDGDAMDGALLIATVVLAHEKLAAGNGPGTRSFGFIFDDRELQFAFVGVDAVEDERRAFS